MLRTSIVKPKAESTTPRVSKRKQPTILTAPSSAKACCIITRFCHPQYASAASISPVVRRDSTGRHLLSRCLNMRDVGDILSISYRNGWFSSAYAYDSCRYTCSHRIGREIGVDHSPGANLNALRNSNTRQNYSSDPNVTIIFYRDRRKCQPTVEYRFHESFLRMA